MSQNTPWVFVVGEPRNAPQVALTASKLTGSADTPLHLSQRQTVTSHAASEFIEFHSPRVIRSLAVGGRMAPVLLGGWR